MDSKGLSIEEVQRLVGRLVIENYLLARQVEEMAKRRRPRPAPEQK